MMGFVTKMEFCFMVLNYNYIGNSLNLATYLYIPTYLAYLPIITYPIPIINLA
jgi:hypothetical protein